MTQTDRLQALDGLRGLAALAVFAWHVLDVFYPGMTRLPAFSPWAFLYHGPAAVGVFFVLSGFVLTRISGQARVYLPQRYFRLLPLVLVGTCLGAAVLAFDLYLLPAVRSVAPGEVYAPGILPPSLPRVAFQALWGVWFGLPSEFLYDRVLWSIGVEFKGSLILLSCLPVLRGARGAALLLLGFGSVLLGLDFLYFWTGYLLSEWHAVGRNLPRPLALAAGAAGLLLLGLKVEQPLAGVLLRCLAAAGLVCAALTLHPPRFVLFLGRVSYPLYVLHQPLLHSLAVGIFLTLRPLGYEAAAGTGALLTLAVSLGAGEALVRWVDQPCNRWSKGWFSSKPSARSDS